MAAGEISYYNSLIEEELAEDVPDHKYVREIVKERRAVIREMRQGANEAMRSGLSESHLRLAERMAGIVGDAIIEVTNKLRMNARQKEELPEILEAVLTRLEIGADPGQQVDKAVWQAELSTSRAAA
jgi:hypothetical protein